MLGVTLDVYEDELFMLVGPSGCGKLVICDEPTSSLDHRSGGQVVMKLLKELTRAHRTTMIVVTHDERVYKYADRIAYMEDGKIIKVEENK